LAVHARLTQQAATLFAAALLAGVCGPVAAQGRGGGLPAAGPPVPNDAPGLEVLREVHRRYSTTRFRTLTFTQRTTFPDGRIEWWYEAESVPGKARVDVAPFADRNAQIFRNDSAYVFRNGERTQASAGLAITMWALMDMYAIAPEQTAAQMSRRGFDLTRTHERDHRGRPVVVLGALAGDTTSAQLWLDKEHLYTVRIITSRGGRRVTDVGKHVFQNGGWVEQEIRVYALDGSLNLLEEYFDVRTNVELPPDLFEPDRYRTPPWTQTRP
jgi:hypothetical protein